MKPGDGRRVTRVEKEVQESIARYLLDLRGELPGLVTVSKVMMPGDLRTAKVYISVIVPSPDGLNQDEAKAREDVVELLQDQAADIQDFINSELELRFCPKLTFYGDESTGKILKVEKILQNLATGKKSDE